MISSLFKIRHIGFLSILLVISFFILKYGNNDKIETDANKQDNITPISRALQTKEGRIKLEKEILKFKKVAGKNRNEANTTIEKKSESNHNLNELDDKREKIREMMRHAWHAYKNYSWGENELRPISKSSYNQDIFGSNGMAATIIDAADTLWIMGLKDEYEQTSEFIRDNFDIKKATGQLSVFETTIRFVGGLLSLFSLTKEEFYLEKAKSIADVLLQSFDTITGIPKSLLNPSTGVAINYQMANHSSILAEFGTLHLEFAYLTEVTNEPIYLEKVQKIRDILDKAEKSEGLYPSLYVFVKRLEEKLHFLTDQYSNLQSYEK